MSALAMILMAGIAVGDGPKKDRGEVEQRLDLSGEWKGTWVDDAGNVWETEQQKRMLAGHFKGTLMWLQLSEIVDEGKGKFHMDWGAREYVGIYKQKGGVLIMSYRAKRHGYPSSFEGGDGSYLLILHRVKLRK